MWDHWSQLPAIALESEYECFKNISGITVELTKSVFAPSITASFDISSVSSESHGLAACLSWVSSGLELKSQGHGVVLRHAWEELRTVVMK